MISLLLACASEPTLDRDLWGVPEHFPDPAVPQDNPLTPARVELGRYLFYDFGLSDTGTRSCGICHETAKGFTDGFVRAVGTHNDIHPRNTLSVINAAWRGELGWVPGSNLTLEQQLLIPLLGEHPIEMGMSEALLLERINDNPVYPPLFEQAFGDAEPTLEHAAMAIAGFERSIIGGRSPYDAWLQGTPLPEDAERGRALFFGEETQCSRCHGGLFLDSPTNQWGQVTAKHGAFNTGLYNVDGEGAYPETAPGLIAKTGRARDSGVFRTPSLRNVSLTGPWGHDGSVGSLQDMLDSYARGGRLVSSGANPGDGATNPHKSKHIQGFDLSEAQAQDLLAFLDALTDESLLEDARYQSPFCPFDINDTGTPAEADCIPDSRPPELLP